MRDGQIVYTNPAAVKLLSADSNEALIGRSLAAFVSPAFQPTLADQVEHARPLDSQPYSSGELGSHRQ